MINRPLSTYNKSVLIKKIVDNLENKGESPYYIIGFMSAMINNIVEMNADQTVTYLESTARQTQSL